MRVVAFIPAKGHSERLPQKNLAQLGGLPLVAWTIVAAGRAGLFDEIVVSSESEEVLALASRYGARPLARPEGLAQPTVPVDAVVAAALPSLRTHPNGPAAAPWALYVLLPTAPFRSPATITVAWKTFRCTDNVHRLLSLVPVAHPPEWCLRLTAQGTVQPLLASSVRTLWPSSCWAARAFSKPKARVSSITSRRRMRASVGMVA